MAETTEQETLPLSTADVTQEVAIRMGKSGWAAKKPITVMQMFDNCVAAHGSKPALHQKIVSTCTLL